MLFYQIIDEFKRSKVPYVVVGGYALALHGIVRDILITTDISELDVVQISVGGYKVAVASLQTLLQMKKISGRPQDLVDIDRINEVLNEKKKS